MWRAPSPNTLLKNSEHPIGNKAQSAGGMAIGVARTASDYLALARRLAVRKRRGMLERVGSPLYRALLEVGGIFSGEFRRKRGREGERAVRQ